jgi:hypothetical protein
MDMQYCVENLGELRKLEGKSSLSKFSDFWAPDYKNTTPMKAAFTPENLMTNRVPLLARFYDPGLTTTDGEADSLNPPYFRISRELMGRVVHTLRNEYISDDDNGRISKEFEEHVKVVLAPLETTLQSTLTRLSEHHAASIEQHEKLVKDAHDHLAEASVKFKAAVERQVDLMVIHNDGHGSLKEGIQKLAIQARKEFRKISYASPLTPTSVPNTTETETSAPAYLLKMANKDLEKRQANWDEQRSEYVKRIKQLEEEKKKLLDQISHVGVKKYQSWSGRRN